MHKLAISAVLLTVFAAAQTINNQTQGAASNPATSAQKPAAGIGAAKKRSEEQNAQVPADKAWTVLQAGLKDKSTNDRAAAVNALGLLGAMREHRKWR